MNKCLFCGTDTKYIYCSLSCSNKDRPRKNESKYNLDPKRCACCGEPIPYDHRAKNTYCSRSCAASINNKVPKRKKTTKVVLDRNVQKENRFLVKLKLFQIGQLEYRGAIRQCLIRTMGNICAMCKLPGSWEGQPLTLVVDHIDGNAGNNFPSNLRLLCPNCNSQTPTFCGRNFGNGRQSRGLPKS